MSFAPRKKSRLTRTGDPFAFRVQLEELWLRAPTTTINAAMRITGASKRTALTVRQRLVSSGRIPRTHRDKERIW